MKSDDIVERRHEPGAPLPETDTDWDFLMSLSDEEVTRRALEDPDNPPLETIAHRLRRVVNVLHLRRRLGLTQQEFADRYDLPAKFVDDLETRRILPNAAARALLTAIDRDPETMAALLRRAA